MIAAKEIAARANECCYRTDGYEEEIEALVVEAILAEREACAAIAEGKDRNVAWTPREIAAAIRART